jgi:hypothetical protein
VALTPDQFDAALLASRQRTNDLAVAWLRQGVQVWLPPLMVAGKHGTREQCVDAGDMSVVMRVEHKVRSLTWSSRDDYPYPDVMLEEQYKIDNKPSPFLCYVIESGDGKCAAVVYGWTRPHWVYRSTFDRRSGRGGQWAFCPKKWVRFCHPKEVFRCDTL